MKPNGLSLEPIDLSQKSLAGIFPLYQTLPLYQVCLNPI